MDSRHTLGQKNPLLQRMRRHTEMATLFRSPRQADAPTWTAEIVDMGLPQPLETSSLPLATMAESRPFVPQTPTIQPTTSSPAVQRQQAEPTAPTVWQRVKNIFRKEAAPTQTVTPIATNSHTAESSITPQLTTHEAPNQSTNTDTFSLIQRQPQQDVSNITQRTVHEQLAVSNNQSPTFNLQSPISRTTTTQAPISQRPETQQSKPQATLTPLQAIYNAHHPESAETNPAPSVSRKEASPANPQTPIVNRQSPPSAVSDDGSFPWGTLQDIYNVHKSTPSQGNPPTVPAQAAQPNPVDEPHLPEQPVSLDAIWPVEKTVQNQTTAVSPSHPNQPTAIQRTAADQAQDSQLRAKLETVTPARPSDSSVEIVTPRRPRPILPGAKTPSEKTAVPAPPVTNEQSAVISPDGHSADSNLSTVNGGRSPEGQQPTPQSLVSNLQRQNDSIPQSPITQQPKLAETTVETEIGALPADLWSYLGKQTPEARAIPDSNTLATPHTSLSTKDTMAIQRTIDLVEARTSDSDTPLPAVSLIPIANEPTETAVTTPTTNNVTTQPLHVESPKPNNQLSPNNLQRSVDSKLSPTSPTPHPSKGESAQAPETKHLISEPTLQQAISLAEASPTRQENTINQAVITEIPKQSPMSQREVGIPQQAGGKTAVTPNPNTPASQSITAVSQPNPIQRQSDPAKTIMKTEAANTDHSLKTQSKSPRQATPTTYTQDIQSAIVNAEAAPIAATPSETGQQSLMGSPPAAIQRTETEATIADERQISQSPNLTTPQPSNEPRTIDTPPTASRDTDTNIGDADTDDAPDVDELARQVYSDLKRRLTVEWERSRGRIIT